MDGLIQLDVDIDSMIVCVSIFSCSFSVRMYHCTALSAVSGWICALQVSIVIITYDVSAFEFFALIIATSMPGTAVS